jgi:hypothetical protein
MKHYGLIKASRLEGGGRVNRVVGLDLPPDATGKDLQHVLDAYCAAQGWSFIAFHPYGPSRGGDAFASKISGGTIEPRYSGNIDLH